MSENQPSHCAHCGAELGNDVAFCEQCGHKVKLAGSPDSEPAVPAAFVGPHVPKLPNHEARVARIAFWVLIGFVVLAFVPGWAGIDMMEKGFALVMLCVFFAIASSITWLLFRRRARMLDRFLKGRDVLIRWNIPADVWVRHVAEDLKEEKEGKKGLFLIAAFWVVLIGGGFAIFAGEAGRMVALVLLGVLAILVPFAFWLPKVRAARMLKRPTPVIIGREGAYVGGELHDWKLVGSFLSGAKIDDTKDPKQVCIDYYYISGRGAPVPCEVRLPIPPGKDEEAKHAVEELKLKRKKKHTA